MINPVHSTRMPSLWLGRCGPFDSNWDTSYCCRRHPRTAVPCSRLGTAQLLPPHQRDERNPVHTTHISSLWLGLGTKEVNATLSTPPTAHLFGWGLGASQGNISVEFLETQGGGPAKAG